METELRDAGAWREAGRSARKAGDAQEALKCYLEAMAAEHAAGNSAEEMHDARHVADLHREMGEFEEGKMVIERVLGFYREHPPNDLELGNTLRIAGLIAEAQGDEKGALAYWRNAGVMYEKVGVEAGIEEARRRVARLSILRKD